MEITKRMRQQVANNQSRARSFAVLSTLTLEDWVMILGASGGRCAYCTEIIGVDHLFLEHILSMSRGGTNTADNVTTACLTCNSRKGDSLLGERGHKAPHTTYRLAETTPPALQALAAAAALGFTRQYVARLCKAGKLPARLVATPRGPVYEINPADLDKVRDLPMGRPPKT